MVGQVEAMLWNINNIFENLVAETVAQECSVKKVFSEVSRNSQENTCARVSI